jgi:hypothetical protein
LEEFFLIIEEKTLRFWEKYTLIMQKQGEGEREGYNFSLIENLALEAEIAALRRQFRPEE